VRRVGIRKGEEWGSPTGSAPDLVVEGNDADLAAAVQERPGALVRYVPSSDSDLARTVGGSARDVPIGTELPMDALRVDGRLVVNSVIIGIAPRSLRAWHRRRQIMLEIDGRALDLPAVTTVAVLNGQHLAGDRLLTRGHPGDGRAEVQWFAIGPSDRSKLRARLATGDHLGHPAVGQETFRELVVDAPGRRACCDGIAVPNPGRLVIRVVAAAYRLLL